MKKLIQIVFIFLFFSVSSFAQISNLLVAGVNNNFSAVPGSLFGWSYNVPNVGDTAYIQIWVDTDNNGILNNTIDVIWTTYMQVDGNSESVNGLPDIDGTANGKISFQQKLGLAPAHYIFYFKNNNIIRLVAGQITDLSTANQKFTFSGSVKSGGSGRQNVIVKLASKNEKRLWSGITDVNGNFSIKMDSDTTGNPWQLRIDNSLFFRPDVATPDRYTFSIDPGVSTTHSNIDFTITPASAYISGFVYGENGQPFVGQRKIYVSADNNYLNRNAIADSMGYYEIGLIPEYNLPRNNVTVGIGDSWDTTYVASYHNFPTIITGNHLTHNFKVFLSNSVISGRITINGNSPNQNFHVNAFHEDSAMVETWSDMNGYFRLKVTDKISYYNINLLNYPQYLIFVSPSAHASDTNLLINLVSTDVKLIDSETPSNYSLSQNYPNPFNPATIINYEIPKTSHVTISVYNVLGQEITKLVNRDQTVGKYSVDFNAAYLTSGIYFYSIQAGNFTLFKKMIFMK
ncbi:MAG: T9SS type A sorting domain-containing protein [Melioribacteraceae bacterium]